MIEAVILLDTNVVSELMRPKPAQAVLDWFAAQDSTKLLFSAESAPELCRQSLSTSSSVLPFDSAATKAYAALPASRRRQSAGQPTL